MWCLLVYWNLGWYTTVHCCIKYPKTQTVRKSTLLHITFQPKWAHIFNEVEGQHRTSFFEKPKSNSFLYNTNKNRDPLKLSKLAAKMFCCDAPLSQCSGIGCLGTVQTLKITNFTLWPHWNTLKYENQKQPLFYGQYHVWAH